MDVKASVKFIRMSPRKVRLVVDAVRGLEVNKALDILKFMNKLAVKPVTKLVNSAVANALNNYELDKDNLLIKEIRVDDGPTTHRWMPRAYGRATPIRKRTCHINLVLSEIKDSGKKEAKSQKIEAPIKLGTQPKEKDPSASSGQEKKDKFKDEDKPKEQISEKGRKIVDPRLEGRGGHAKIEGKGHGGIIDKMFRRKSG